MIITHRGKGASVLDYVIIAASTFRDIADSSSVPFLRTVAAVSISISTTVQSVKSNKEECTRMVSHIEELLSAIPKLYFNESDVSPTTLHNIGRFADTLQKIHTFVNAQQNTSILKQLFRQSANTALLEECNSGLRHALDVFGVFEFVKLLSSF
ncbi:hypothetical protein DFH08DRAFT_799733 [Mycena albidolilacea]|uniref:Mixed lineage kinase domain-containing protein n=1 Tax=Mycena albidolilacea TaxID=1033008 RepID=A0AAD7F2C2_9AGAR|nr:hypothetical protein DFH08DRAFT_799733 [Mycena albidolilacea]